MWEAREERGERVGLKGGGGGCKKLQSAMVLVQSIGCNLSSENHQPEMSKAALPATHLLVD